MLRIICSGDTAQESTGKNFPQLLSADHDTYFTETISQHIAEHKSWEGILSFTKTNESEHVLPVTILPVNDEHIGISGYFIIIKPGPNGEQPTHQDISKEQIILSEQKWRSLLDNTRGAIFLIDTSYHIILVNEKAQKVLNHSTASPGVPGQAIYLPDLLPIERQEPVKKMLGPGIKRRKDRI